MGSTKRNFSPFLITLSFLLIHSGCTPELISKTDKSGNTYLVTEDDDGDEGGGGGGGGGAPVADGGEEEAQALSYAEFDDAKFGVVAILWKGSHVCDGAILNNNAILTSATCAQSLTLGLTEVHMDALEIGAGSTIAVSAIHMHPEFDNSGFFPIKDVAILKLDSEINFSGTIQPLAFAKNTTLDAEATVGSVFGWNSPGALSYDELQVFSIEVAAVAAIENEWKVGGLDASLTGAQEKGAGCASDNGSPMVSNDGTKAVITGILTKADSDDCAIIPVYTKISTFSEWITETLENL